MELHEDNQHYLECLLHHKHKNEMIETKEWKHGQYIKCYCDTYLDDPGATTSSTSTSLLGNRGSKDARLTGAGLPSSREYP
jgi:hypothetical protein